MTELNQVWKCNVCGNIVETVHTGKGGLTCCGKTMEVLTGKTKDIGYEKHLPMTEGTGTTLTVKVGTTPHPMEETHYIEWVEVLTGDRTYRKYLTPGDEPSWTWDTRPTTTTTTTTTTPTTRTATTTTKTTPTTTPTTTTPTTTKTQVRAYCNVHGLWTT